MSSSQSHGRHPSGSSSVSSSGSYSRPLSSRPPSQSITHNTSHTITQPTSPSYEDHPPPRSFARPRAGGVDFGQPLAEETAGTHLGELTPHHRRPPPAGSSSASTSRIPRDVRYSSSGQSTASSTSSSSSSYRTSHRERQSSTASSPLPSSSPSSASASATNRLSQPLPLTPSSPTTSSRPHRSPISPTHPNYASTQTTLRRKASVPPRASSLQQPGSTQPAPTRPTPPTPSTAASRRISKAPSIGSLSSSHQGVNYSPSSSSTAKAAPGMLRSSSATAVEGNQRNEGRTIIPRASFEGAPSSWKAPVDAEEQGPVRVQGRRRSSLVQSEAARGRQMLDNSSTDDEADDLLGHRESRRPSWVSVKIPTLAMTAGRSDSTTTITQASTRRDDRDDHLSWDEPSTSSKPPDPSASDRPPVTSGLPSTSTSNGARPSPTVLPSFTAAPSQARAVYTGPPLSLVSPNGLVQRPIPGPISIPSPVSSPPALPTRSPLRPRLSSPTPSQTSSSSSTGHTRHQRQGSGDRLSVAFSEASIEVGEPRVVENDSSRLGVGGTSARTDRMRSVSSPGVASWSSANGKERETAFEPMLTSAPEVWLDDDLDRPSSGQTNGGLSKSATPSSGGSLVDGEARPRSRPPSVGSRPGSERMKQKRREARVSESSQTWTFANAKTGAD